MESIGRCDRQYSWPRCQVHNHQTSRLHENSPRYLHLLWHNAPLSRKQSNQASLQQKKPIIFCTCSTSITFPRRNLPLKNKTTITAVTCYNAKLGSPRSPLKMKESKSLREQDISHNEQSLMPWISIQNHMTESNRISLNYWAESSSLSIAIQVLPLPYLIKYTSLHLFVIHNGAVVCMYNIELGK